MRSGGGSRRLLDGIGADHDVRNIAESDMLCTNKGVRQRNLAWLMGCEEDDVSVVDVAKGGK